MLHEEKRLHPFFDSMHIELRKKYWRSTNEWNVWKKKSGRKFEPNQISRDGDVYLHNCRESFFFSEYSHLVASKLSKYQLKERKTTMKTICMEWFRLSTHTHISNKQLITHKACSHWTVPCERMAKSLTHPYEILFGWMIIMMGDVMMMKANWETKAHTKTFNGTRENRS